MGASGEVSVWSVWKVDRSRDARTATGSGVEMARRASGWCRLVSVAAAGLIAASPVGGQERRSDSMPEGWERFVVPVLTGGGSGIAYFPTTGGAEGVFDPRGFEVHLTDADDPGEELVHPAGEPFWPPAGLWRGWLQGEWSMSPSSHVFSSPPPRGEGISPSLVEVAPAGRVTVDDGLASDLELRLLAAGNDPRTFEMSRRRLLGEVGEGVLMPQGPVLAAAWNRREERYVALGRADVLAERTVAAPLAAPRADRSALVVYVANPSEAPWDEHIGVELTVSRGGEERRPDAAVTTHWGVHAVWYDLPPGPAVLAGGNARQYLEPRPLELVGGEIDDFDGVLSRRPLLEVTMVLPSLLRERPLTLEVNELPGKERLVEVELPRTAGRHRFQDELVKGVLEVVLTTHVGKFRRQIDLTTEEEGFLALEPEVIDLFGIVRHGGERHPATVRFQTVAGDPVEAVADEEGEYEAVALQPLRWVDVELSEVDQEPWRDLFAPAVDSSRELDFDIPDAEVTVRVLDATTREGIAGAKVHVGNRYLPPAEAGGEDGEDRRGRERMIGQGHTADEAGLVRLPPPRPGRVEIHATADGYRAGAEPLRLEVADPPQDAELEIALEPHGERVAVHLTLPDGSAAAGAEVLRVDPAAGGALYSGRADAAGVVEVPVEPVGGLLLLKHPGAAFAVVDWQPWAGEERVDWSFPPAAGRPLSVRVLDPAGDEPVRQAEISLWVGGRLLSGRTLMWLTGAPPMTRPNGFWRVEGVPAVTVHVLARAGGLRGEQQHPDALAGMATEIAFPWPDLAEVRAVR